MPKSNPFVKTLRTFIRRSGYRPANKSELARALEVKPKDRAKFREALKKLESSGELVQGRKGRYTLPDEAGGSGGPAVTGTISFPPTENRRSGFFTPDPEIAEKSSALKGIEGDIHVPARYAATAMHGDRVAVKLARKPPPRWHRYSKKHRDRARPEGTAFEARVSKVLERRHVKIVGTFRKHGRFAHLLPDNPRLPGSFNLSNVLKKARPGDKVVAEFEGWDSSRIPPRARMIEVLGRPDAPGVDMMALIHRHGLPLKFPKAVLAEADAIDETIEASVLETREDWRDREVFTIDPEDARDFDDAICVEKIEGGWELAVHIADVSHYVKNGSALDKEAHKRGNSVYLADRVIPMLPEKLSNGVCSLKEGVDRLTHAVIMRFSNAGKMKSARFVSSVICSQRRFTYEEAYALMGVEGKKAGSPDSSEENGLAEHLNRAWKLAAMLRKRRFEAGGLDLDFPEVRAVLDEDGVTVDVKRVEHDESHQLIEEFMLAANEAVARESKNTGSPSIYRIHEDPDPEKLFDFAQQAGDYGHPAGDVTNRAELQRILRAIRGKPEEHSLKIALLKSLKRAAYSAEPLGHYGLAKLNYTHFTSPIRRYADLVVHRILRKLESQRSSEKPDPTPSQAKLASIARHISDTERSAADAEQESQRLKLIDYLVRLGKEDSNRTFEGVVLDIRPIGAFVELTDLLIKGLIRKEDLPPNDYRFDSARQQLTARHGKFELTVGHQVRVRVIRVDRVRGFIDFELVQ